MKKTFSFGVIIAGAIIALAIIGFFAGARVNTSKSIRLGLYWVSSAPVKKGAYVIFCPPQREIFDIAMERGYIKAGFCPGGYGYMIKRVLAAKNDVVTIADDGVRVNGEQLPFSAPMKTDKAGRPLSRYEFNSYTLDSSEVLLMTDVSATSFDGRYFGPISRSQIKTVVRPIITW